jgi:hypothetical protein
MQKDYLNSPVFILAPPRSGTSLVAGCLQLCGAWTGSTVQGDSTANPKGFFEHIAIREQITKKILLRLGCDPLGVSKLPPLTAKIEVENFVAAIKHVLEKDGYQHDKPWLYKDAKLTLLWPVYLKWFPHASWVYVKRDKADIIRSCLRTSFMRQHSRSEVFWSQFVDEYTDRINALKQASDNVTELDSGSLVAGKFEPLQALVQDLGLTYKEQEIKEFISPGYWHVGVL